MTSPGCSARECERSSRRSTFGAADTATSCGASAARSPALRRTYTVLHDFRCSSSFRKDPLNRLKRTGLAAMISVYGARSVAELMIARVVRMHASVQGTTAAGIRYSANDSRLLTWVHATAAFGFAAAYNQYVQPLSAQNFNDFYREGAPVSRLYGAIDSPHSLQEMQALFESMRSWLAPSAIIFEFLRKIGRAH